MVSPSRPRRRTSTSPYRRTGHATGCGSALSPDWRHSKGTRPKLPPPPIYLTGLFGSNELAVEADVDRALAAWQDARRTIAGAC